MHILTKIHASAAALNAQWNEPRGHVATVHHEAAPGCFIHLGLGTAGLVMHHDGIGVAIPIATLIELAQKHCPELIPEPPPKSTQAAVSTEH